MKSGSCEDSPTVDVGDRAFIPAKSDDMTPWEPPGDMEVMTDEDMSALAIAEDDPVLQPFVANDHGRT